MQDIYNDLFISVLFYLFFVLLNAVHIVYMDHSGRWQALAANES